MRKFGVFFVLASLMLSGCALNSDIAIRDDGTVVGTISLGIPKSALRKVTTLEQWTALAAKNNITGVTTDGVNCLTTDDIVGQMWSYTCSIDSQNASVLVDPDLSPLSSFQFDRSGQTLNISSVNAGGDLTNGGTGGLGLDDVSMIYYTSKLTIPGSCTTSAPSGVTITTDDVKGTSTVTIEGDQSSSSMSASCTLTAPAQTGTSTSLAYSALAANAANSSVLLTATATPSNINGVFAIYDGTTLLGTTSAIAGVGIYQTSTVTPGAHALKAVFKPTDFWNNGTSTSSTVTLSGFNAKPRVTCAKAVGSICKVVLGTSNATPDSVTYRWFNSGKVIANAKTATFKRRKNDRALSVVVTYKKTGFVTRAWTLRLAR